MLFQDFRRNRRLKRTCSNVVKGVFLWLMWPVWCHGSKAYYEGLQLINTGKDEEVKAKRDFLKRRTISSRAQISEVCSEATFQPILQLYLLLPKLMCIHYESLIDLKITEISELQFWSIVTSCLSLAWSFNVSQAVMKNGALDFGTNFIGRLVLLLSCICQISARLFIIVLLAYSCEDGNFWPMMLAISIHMLGMAFVHWRTIQLKKHDSRENKGFRGYRHVSNSKMAYQCLLHGVSNLYMYMRVPPLFVAKKAKDQIWVDLIFVIENIVVVSLAYAFVEDLPFWILLAVLTVHTVGLLLKVIYYQKFHIWSSLIPCCPCNLHDVKICIGSI